MIPANTVIGSDATDPAPFYQQPGFWGLMTLVLVVAIVLTGTWYFDRPQVRNREAKRDKKQATKARWKVVSDVVRPYNAETVQLGDHYSIYELKIALVTLKGQSLKAVELWRINMTEPEFATDRGVKWGEAQNMANDLNSELDKPEIVL